jgi:hypothetical protein
MNQPSNSTGPPPPISGIPNQGVMAPTMSSGANNGFNQA